MSELEDNTGAMRGGKKGAEVRIILLLSVSVLLLYIVARVIFHSGDLLLYFSGGVAVILMETAFISWAYRKKSEAGTGEEGRQQAFPDTEYSRIVRRAGMALDGREYSRELILKELWSMMIERASIKLSIRQPELRAMLEQGTESEYDFGERHEVLRKYHMMSKSDFAGQAEGLYFAQELDRFFDEMENY